ncbi:MAG: PPC domain-containing protein [Planctomycetia bacterium]|nr:PPC domain-containing protein [Planctomycetia bacterium]
MFASLRAYGIRFVATAVVVCCTAPNFVSAANPSLSSIAPNGGKRGGDIEVQVSGRAISDAPELVFYSPGIKVKSIEQIKDKAGVVNDNLVKAVLTLAPDCRLGGHAFRIRTASGLSDMPILFSVGALDVVEEKEPNSEFTTPQEIPLGVTINGSIGNEDVDYFVVNAKKGDRISAEVEGIRLGRAAFDPYLAILDSDRFELARSDDSAMAWYDCTCSVLAPADGKYTVLVRESTFVGGSVYRLHIGKFPRPTAMIPAGGKPGETLDVTLLGDPSGPIKQKYTVPAKPEFLSSTYAKDDKATPFFPKDALGIAPSPLVFRVSNLNNVLEVEPNDEPAKGTTCEAPIAMNGVIEKPRDVDCFQFKGTKGQVLEIRVHARSLRSPLDSVLTVLRLSNGSSLGTNDDSAGPDSYLRVNIPADDVYVVQVKDMLDQGGADFSYRVEVTPVEPSVALTFAEKIQYVDVTMPVAKGNRGALMVNVQRIGWNGDLKLDLQNVPKGMKYETLPLLGNMTNVPVLFTAADDAPVGASTVGMTVSPTDPKAEKVTGFAKQTTMLIRGGNNAPIYTQTIHGLTTAVIEKVPFKIEIMEPKVPLVKNGSMDLKVRVVRAKDFKAPIAIRMLFNPPGVSASSSAQIAEGKDEGILQITAGSNAEIKDWKILVLGTANVVNGPVEVASQFATLKIGQPFFDFAMKPSAGEQGKPVSFVAQITNNVEFTGKAKVQLVGLPAEAVCPEIEIGKDATEAIFNVTTTTKTPPGRHKAIYVNLVVMQNGEPVAHTFGPGEIRVDAPLPPKVTAKPAAAAVVAKPQPAAVVAKPAAPRALSRLETLRLQKNQDAAAPATGNNK